MVVDRKIAVLNSNNIQDRPNLEVSRIVLFSRRRYLTSLSFTDDDSPRRTYRRFDLRQHPHLVSIFCASRRARLTHSRLNRWNNVLTPSLPCLAEPSPYSTHAPSPFAYTFADSNIYLAQIDVAKAAKAARILLNREDAKAQKGEQRDRLSPPEWWGRESSPNTPGVGLGHHRMAWFGGSGATTPEEGEGGNEHAGGKFAGLVMQLVDKAREERARLALGMGGQQTSNQTRDISMSPSAATGVSTAPHGQTSATLATPGEAPTEVPASYLEGRSSVADSGIDLHSKKSDKSVTGEDQAKTEELEMRQLQAQGVASQDFGDAGATRIGNREDLRVNTEREFPFLSFEKLECGLILFVLSLASTAAASNSELPPGFEVADASQGLTLPHQPPPTTAEKNNAADSPVSPSKGTASSARLAALSKALNAGALTEIQAAIEDESLISDFKPHMLHRKHKPCRTLYLSPSALDDFADKSLSKM